MFKNQEKENVLISPSVVLNIRFLEFYRLNQFLIGSYAPPPVAGLYIRGGTSMPSAAGVLHVLDVNMLGNSLLGGF